MAAQRIVATLLATLVSLMATTVAAQESAVPAVTLTGRVIHAESSEPAPYSTIDIVEAGIRRFTDAQGQFTISPLAAGTYHVRARQLGFAPLDTTVTLSSSSQPLVLRMRVVPIALRSVRITAMGTCSHAQFDTADDPTLAALLAAVRENAERELLLRRAYPFVFGIEATQTTDEDGRRVQREVDTLNLRSDAFHPYRPGGIVFVDSMMSGRVRRRMRLPTTVDFADPNFLANHCIAFAGVEHGAYQIAFKPLESIFTPDVEGSIALDSATFVIRSAVIRLTRPWKVDPDLQSVEARTTYSEILPAVVVASQVQTTQTYHPPALIRGGSEVQRLVALSFLGRVPDGLSATPKVP